CALAWRIPAPCVVRVGGLILSSGTCNRNARVPGRRQTGWAALSAAPSTRNMATGVGADNRPSQVELTARFLRVCSAVRTFARATKLRRMQPRRIGHAAPFAARASQGRGRRAERNSSRRDRSRALPSYVPGRAKLFDAGPGYGTAEHGRDAARQIDGI